MAVPTKFHSNIVLRQPTAAHSLSRDAICMLHGEASPNNHICSAAAAAGNNSPIKIVHQPANTKRMWQLNISIYRLIASISEE
jgi:hypothetical protein